MPGQQLELSFGPDEVVLRIFHLVVLVAVYIVHEETQYLLVCDIPGRERKILPLDVGQEASGLGQIAAQERIVHLPAHGHVVQVRVVLGTSVGVRTDGISEVIQARSLEHCVQIENTQYVAFLVKQHIGYLGVIVSYSQGYLSVFYQLVKIQHHVSSGLHLGNQVTDGSGSVLRIPGQSVVPLSETELNIVKPGKSVYQRLVKIREHCLEFAYAAASALGQQRSVRLVVADGVSYKYRYTPIFSLINIIEPAVIGRHHCERLPHGITSGCPDFLLEMDSYSLNIVHHTGYILENVCILALKNILNGTSREFDDICVVDKSVTESIHLRRCAVKLEAAGYL